MNKLFSRLFLSILSVSLFILFFVLFFITIFFLHTSKQWSTSAFDEFSNRLAVCISENDEKININELVQIALNCSAEDNRISGLIFKDEEGRVLYSYGKTQIGEKLSQRKSLFDLEITQPILEEGVIDDTSFKNVVINSPINMIQVNQINNQLLVDLIRLNNSDSIFDKREIEVPKGVDSSSITGSIMIMDEDVFSFAIDVLIFSPTTYKYSKDIFSIGTIWLVSIILIAIQFSLVLSYHFSKQLESYAKGLKKALNKLSKGEENVELPFYNVEEYHEINSAVKLLDNDLSQNRKNRKAWLRNITHDFNTPITSMQILLDGIGDKIFPLNEDTIALLKKEHNNLSKRINRVVLYASIQSPDKEIEIANCFTKDIIDSINRLFSSFDRIKFVELDDYVLADYSTIVLALTCLIENALEYSEGDVIVELSQNKIKVINNGEIEADNTIFEPWERGDESRTAGGNGLGLPIVYEVMKLHKGLIKIKSLNNKVYATMKWEN